ncbi:phosphotransacetylase family protein [Cyanobium sp. ATX 6F1]|uniref:phosphotransacetylase family protein n=1 Tax=unclassified Cyanobium TaxID=2627006 RepID=UPI0020CE328E|nr:phosphotransacetylase family protein [Cyanobium sp. ATX 6F1]MCP9915788.1 phosphotransacetylase family protein [Cyanobium sp. ATX 6F1]
MAPTLLIGSCHPFSGKSAVVLGLGRQLVQQGLALRFGKPLATSCTPDPDQESIELIDDDVRFVGSILGLAPEQLLPSLDLLEPATALARLLEGRRSSGPGFELLQRRLGAFSDGVTLLEAAGTLSEGLLYGLNLSRLAEAFAAPVVLVHRWEDSLSIDALLEAQQQLGEHLAGVVLNSVNPDQVGELRAELVPALEALGLPVFGVMPRSPLLRSVTVEELAGRLGARVLCCRERLDLLVETLSIGAMNVNSAMEFFRRRRNMAVVTGADRTDIQLAALEASTQCLILTGASEPLPQLINRAEELEVPILKVEHDTLTTVEVVERAFGHARLHESVKATYAFKLVQEHCSFNRLFDRLRLPQRA